MHRLVFYVPQQSSRALLPTIFPLQIAIGCIVSSAAIFWLSVEDSDDNQGTQLEMASDACMIVPALYSLGFIITFAALFVKLHKVYEIMRACKALAAVKIKFVTLLAYVVALVTVDGAILAAWASNAPLEYIRQVTSRDLKNNPASSIGMCASPRGPGDTDWQKYVSLIAALHVILCVQQLSLYACRNISTVFSGPSTSLLQWFRICRCSRLAYLSFSSSETRHHPAHPR